MLSFIYKSPPTYKSPPVVLIPPADANVVTPIDLKFSPTFKFFSIPTPPSITTAPLSLSSEYVVSDTANISATVTVPEVESKVNAPVDVCTVFPDIFTFPAVATPVTFKFTVVVVPETFTPELTREPSNVKSELSTNSPEGPT